MAEQSARHDQQAHHAHLAETVVGIAASAQQHDQKMEHNDASHAAKIEQMKNAPKPGGGK
jgi:hypothetical protein